MIKVINNFGTVRRMKGLRWKKVKDIVGSIIRPCFVRFIFT